jgi:hypothetical protein
VALVLSGTSPAWADATSESKLHFEEGTKAYNLGEFGKAAQEYKAAYQAKPDPVLLYNIAQAFRLNNDAQQALFFYRSFLRNVPNTPNRKEVEDRISKLEAQLALQRSNVNTAPNNTVAPGSVPPPTDVTQPEAKPVEAKPVEAKPVEAKPVEAKPADSTGTTGSAATGDKPNGTTTAPLVTKSEGGPATQAAAAPTPVYKKWWLWAIVGGVVVAGAAAGAGIAASSGAPAPPTSALGTTVITF